LQDKGVNATLRRRLGADVDAACGQLRRKEEGTEMLLYGLTDPGMVRDCNEDYYAAALWPGRKESFLLVVCDGMGGAKGGAHASRLATEAFVRRMTEERGRPTAALARALGAANAAVWERAQADKENCEGMGTTLVAAVAEPGRVTVLHVGDSRAYLLRNGELIGLTLDHSYVQSLVAKRRITAAEAKDSPLRNYITRAVGVGKRVKGDVAAFPWREGDRLLLCTDGLTGLVSEKELGEILSEDTDISHVTHELVAAACAHGGEDNITALVIENKKEPSL
jgi:protein phosphatase